MNHEPTLFELFTNPNHVFHLWWERVKELSIGDGLLFWFCVLILLVMFIRAIASIIGNIFICSNCSGKRIVWVERGYFGHEESCPQCCKMENKI